VTDLFPTAGSVVARAAGRRELRIPLRILLDALSWAVALVLATLLRFDFTTVPDDTWGGVALAIGVALAGQGWLGAWLGLYRGRFKIASFEELRALLLSMGVTTVVLTVVVLAAGRPVPGSVTLIAGVLALLFAAGGRYTWRAVADHALRPRGDHVSRIVVFGAGETGTQVARLMLRNPESHYVPVAFLDDDPAKRNLHIHGVPVRGARADLARVAALDGATILLLAAPSAPTEVQRAVAREARNLGLAVRALPSLDELIGDRIALGQIRPLVDAELLGRAPGEIDLEAVRHAIVDKRVLVTGAGGSIGAEICRQVAALDPAEIVMLDRDESALQQTQLSIHGHGLLDSPNLVLADIRDRQRVFDVFARWEPQVVFHAAALKHLPLLEQYPEEAVKTNLLGTIHLLEAASQHEVERFINISTDKAANPISVLGYSKRISERFTAWFGGRVREGTYVSVRFGNVLGSRGSLLTTFQHQIAAGGPVTVTHEEVTRYFMTVSEAVQLVLESTVIGASGEVLVFDMGRPVSILQLAEQLIAEADHDITIEITGLRPGEKLHEDLFGDGESDDHPLHPSISHARVPALPPSAVNLLSGEHDIPGLREGLRTLARLQAPSRWAADLDAAAMCGYVVMAADGRIEAMNALGSEYLFGERVSLDAIDQDGIVWDALGPDGAPLDPGANPVLTALREGGTERMVIGMRHRGEPVRWLECSTHPLTDRDESTVAVVCLMEPVDWTPREGPSETSDQGSNASA
jgi:FlaA1/EpsC-like NDP-sugar epimerase